METATARIIEKNVFMVLKYSLLTAHVRLPDCRRGCAWDCPFQLNKRSQLLIGAHNKALTNLLPVEHRQSLWRYLSNFE